MDKHLEDHETLIELGTRLMKDGKNRTSASPMLESWDDVTEMLDRIVIAQIEAAEHKISPV